MSGAILGIRRWFTTAALVATAVATGSAGAQAPPPCAAPATDRFVPGQVRATLRPNYTGTPVAYTGAVLEAIGEQYGTDATPVTLGVYSGAEAVVGGKAFTAMAFTVTDKGTVEDITMLASSLSASFDRNVVAALRDVGASGLLPQRVKGVGRHTKFWMEVETVADADTAHDYGDTAGAVRMRWVSTRIPLWRGAVRPAQVPGHQWVPYPFRAERAAVEDSVLVQFVIGPDGHVVPGTAYLYHAGYRDFVQVIADRLHSLRYVPTTIGGCPVASIAQQPFTFRIERR
jgi:Gram-negative bacterial TonB protein C-terminal